MALALRCSCFKLLLASFPSLLSLTSAGTYKKMWSRIEFSSVVGFFYLLFSEIHSSPRCFSCFPRASTSLLWPHAHFCRYRCRDRCSSPSMPELDTHWQMQSINPLVQCTSLKGWDKCTYPASSNHTALFRRNRSTHDRSN